MLACQTAAPVTETDLTERTQTQRTENDNDGSASASERQRREGTQQPEQAEQQQGLRDPRRANVQAVRLPRRPAMLTFEEDTSKGDRPTEAREGKTDEQLITRAETTESTESTRERPPGPQRELAPEEWEEIQELIPEDPRRNDQVLLQDIYRLNPDLLKQYALDRRRPIRPPLQHQSGTEAGNKTWSNTPFYMEKEKVENHPYLHLFPMLAYALEASQEEEVNQSLETNTSRRKISPVTGEEVFLYDERPKGTPEGTPGWQRVGAYNVLYQPYTGIEHFLLNPWFEPITTTEIERIKTRKGRESNYYNGRETPIGPHWFGRNSLRGVLLETVTSLIQQAALPNTTGFAMRLDGRELTTEKTKENRIRTAYNTTRLQNYLSTPVLHTWSETNYQKDFFGRTGTRGPGFQTPTVHWEFASELLPIIKVTTYSRTVLPLGLAGSPQTEIPEPTEYAVSFVIAFQNRWTSFEEENRWIRRYLGTMTKDETIHYGATTAIGINDPLAFDGRRGAIDEERGILRRSYHNENWPNYWHHTDYMHHSIIGPIALQIFDSPVLKKGTYWQTPQRQHWAAPDYVIGPELYYRYYNVEGYEAGDAIQDSLTPAARANPSWAVMADRYSANAGFPLPGHVLTNELTQPGTEYWEKHEMNQNDW